LATSGSVDFPRRILIHSDSYQYNVQSDPYRIVSQRYSNKPVAANMICAQKPGYKTVKPTRYRPGVAQRVPEI
jgi:hypothetical protein